MSSRLSVVFWTVCLVLSLCGWGQVLAAPALKNGTAGEPMKFGDFILEVPPGWERAPADVEKQDQSWQMADLQGSEDPADPLVVAFPFENAPFSDEKKRLEYLAAYKSSVRKSHGPTLVSEKVTLAGVEFERLRFKDEDGRTTFYLTPYNGASVYHIYVFRPDSKDVFPERALELLSSLKLAGPEYRPPGQTAQIPPPAQARTGAPVTGTGSREPVAFPTVQFQSADPCQAASLAPDGLPWQKPASAAPASPPPGIPASTLTPFLDFNKMSLVQYNGAVSVAIEAMRLLYGELSPEDERNFQNCWAPLFDHPAPAAVEYLNKLNPLLGQFLAGREAFMRTAAASEAAMLDAALAVAANSRDGYLDALAMADRQEQVLLSLQAGLAQVAAQIQALGNPPNPLAAKCEARERYRRSLPGASNLDGEWISDGGSHWYYKTIKRYPDGMLLFYRYSFDFALKLEASGLDASEPGMQNTKDGGLIVIPGLYDMLLLMEEQPGGMLFSSPLDLGISLLGHFLDGDTLYVVSYGTWVQEDWTFRGSEYRRFPSTRDKPPILPGHTWEAVLAVANKTEAERIQRTKEAKQGFPEQFQALLSCDPENLPVPEKKKNPWDEGPYKADDPRSKQAAAASAPPAATAPAKPKAPPKTPAQAVDSAAIQETVAFHQAMIELLNRNLQKEKEELEREPDPERRKELAFRAIQLQSDIQAEQDLITSYQTGQLVHTRSAFDEFAYDKFIYHVREEAARADATRRIAAGVERQIELLPEEMRASMREKSRRILDPKTIGTGDVEKARQLAASLNEMVQGYWEGEAARQEEKDINAQEYEFYANTVVMTGGIMVIGLGSAALAETFGAAAAITIWGPHLIGGIYGGTTGLIAGGPAEGVEQSVAWSSPVGFLATQFVEGWRHGTSGPEAGWQEKLWAGAQQAGTGYVMGKAIQFGAGLAGKAGLYFCGEESRLFKPLVGPSRNVRQAFAAAKLEQDVKDAQSLIKHFQEKQTAMARMRAQYPAGSPQLQQAEQELKQLAASLNSSYHCKWLLKYQGHPSVRRYFSRLVDKSYEETTPEMLRLLKAQGYDVSNLRFKPIRNASSAGTSSMDLDLALQETPGLVITKHGKPVSVGQFQQDAQKAINEAYHKVTGFSATRSEVNLTTSAHQESFASKALLKKNVNLGQLSPEEIASIGKVLGVKMDKIAGDLVLGEIAKMQGQCRESAKEIENMLLKELRQKFQKAPPGSREAQQAQADINYWGDMLKNFRQIGMKETNPYQILQLDRTIRTQTGGKGVQEIGRDLTSTFGR